MIAFPLGGIGTGTISLGGRGNLRDWEIFNRPDKGNDRESSLWRGDAGPSGRKAPLRMTVGSNVSTAVSLFPAGVHTLRAGCGPDRFR